MNRRFYHDGILHIAYDVGMAGWAIHIIYAHSKAHASIRQFLLAVGDPDRGVIGWFCFGARYTGSDDCRWIIIAREAFTDITGATAAGADSIIAAHGAITA